MNWERVESLLGSDALAHLSERRVGIVGLGSGGGYVAVALAMSGVGNLVLIDDDVLEPGNVVRHVADSRYVGQNKAQAVADLVRHRNPKAGVTVIEGRIEAHEDALTGLDLLVVAVDGENSKYAINEMCLRHRLTAVYAGVYERGEGGDVVVIHPYDGPCYACWAQSLRDDLTSGPVGALDYGMIGETGTLDAEPGLWLHVTRVGGVHADLALNELLRATDVYEAMPANTIVMANSAMEILEGLRSEPHTALWVDIPRDPACLVCGDALRQDHARGALTLADLGEIAIDEEGQTSAGTAGQQA
jgi:molybdopterin/thiamine biosynthesis adenylyltransferase